MSDVVIQTWLPLGTVTLAAAICLSVGHSLWEARSYPLSGRNDRNAYVASVVAELPKVEALAPDPRWGFFGAASNWRELGRCETKHDPRMR
jgi:hypothetical protein